MTDIAKEIYRINQNDSDVTANSDAVVEAAGLAAVFSTIWTYIVPEEVNLVITRDLNLFAHIEDDEGGPAEWTDTQAVQIQYQSADLKNLQELWRGTYGQIKEQADQDSIAKYQNERHLKPGDRILINGKANISINTIDVSDSYFSLETIRIRQDLNTQ